SSRVVAYVSVCLRTATWLYGVRLLSHSLTTWVFPSLLPPPSSNDGAGSSLAAGPVMGGLRLSHPSRKRHTPRDPDGKLGTSGSFCLCSLRPTAGPPTIFWRGEKKSPTPLQLPRAT